MNKVFLKFKIIILFIFVIILTACGNNISSNKKISSNISNTSSSIVNDSYPSKYSSNISVEKHEFKVTFDYCYDEIINIVYVADYVSEPIAPSRVGYVFLGWYNGADIFHFNNLVTNDIVLTAKWLNEAEFNNFLLNYEYTGSIIDDNVHVIKYKGTATIINIPSWVISIEANAFKDCSNITEVHMTENVQSIGEGAFSGCGGLEKMTLPFAGAYKDAIDELGLFGYIFGTETYKFGIPVEQELKYGDSTVIYYIAKNLNEVKILDGRLSSGAFSNCINLVKIDLCKGVTNDGYQTFSGCINLESIIIPNGISTYYNVFAGCEKLDHIYFRGTIDEWDGFGYVHNPFHYPFYIASHFYLLNSNNEWYELTSLDIYEPAYIPDYAFHRIQSLINLKIGGNVTDVGKSSFSFCFYLENAEIQNDVTTIGEYTFQQCTNLKNIILPNSLKNIGDSAFSSCNNLENVYYEGSINDWNNIVFGNEYANPMYYADHFYILDANNNWIEVTNQLN